MLLNYLKVGIRNILKHKSFSFINVFGLAAAMAVCMLIMMVIADQKGYDRWQSDKSRIFRVETVGRNANAMVTASSALPLAEKLRKDFPGIEASAALVKKLGGDFFYKDKVATGAGYFADGQLFRVMDYTLTQGDTRTALEKPFSMVISENLAAQLFPHEDAVGKTIKFTNTDINPAGFETGNHETPYGEFQITGILRPTPGKTTLPFQVLGSLSTIKALAADTLITDDSKNWSNVWSNYTYVRMEKGKSIADLQHMLDIVSAAQYPKGPNDQFSFRAVGLADIMTRDMVANNTVTAMPRVILLVLSILCLVVMLSACLNYTNLSVARLLTRAKEVGVRKVSGASRGQVFVQFIVEAMLLSLLSLAIAFGLLLIFQRLFAGMWLNQIFRISFDLTPGMVLLFFGFSIVVGFVAGFLPSMYISLFNPVTVLKGLQSFRPLKRLTLRKVLLTVQFCVSLIFIISVSMVYLQGKHVLNFDYGFRKDNVVDITLFKADNYTRLAHAISSDRRIAAVSACTFPPATGSNLTGMVRRSAPAKDSIQADYIDVDAGCLDVWGLKLVAGRNLPAIPSDSGDRHVLINERMARDLAFGSPGQAVGEHLVLGGKDVEIVGVVKDFQFLDVNRGIEPLMLRNRKSEFGIITVRIQGQDPAGTVAFLQDTWKKVNPNSKFEYKFFDEELLMTHSVMTDAAGVLGVLAFLAVVISCLGLLGMATYIAESRRKEVSLRKILGSNVSQVVVLLSRGFMVLLAVAVVIAVPAAYIINGMWLQFFVSRVSITPLILLVNVLILAAICLLIVFSQAWKVATANPAKSLRTE